MTGAASPVRAAGFASGGGTNFQALLDHQGTQASWRIALLITDRPTAGALERASASGVPSLVIPTKDRSTHEVATEMIAGLDGNGIDAIFLAGYLKLVPPEVVSHYANRMLNIHPALLPAFGGQGMYGMNVHRAVIEAGVRVTGATVHLVDEEYDRGKILAQWPVPVLPGDTPEDVAARVLAAEHDLYPRAVDHLCTTLTTGAELTPFAPPGDQFRLTKNEADQNT